MKSTETRTPDDEGRDLKQIGLNPKSREVLDKLRERELISELVDGMRLGLAVAIDNNRVPDVDAKRGSGRTTSHNLASLDDNGEIRLVIGEMYPDCRESPGRAMEDLIEQGLEIIGKKITDLGETFTLSHIAPDQTSGQSKRGTT